MFVRHARSQLVCRVHSTRHPVAKILSGHHLSMHVQYFTHVIGASTALTSTILGPSIVGGFASVEVPLSIVATMLWSSGGDVSLIDMLVDDASIGAAVPAEPPADMTLFAVALSSSDVQAARQTRRMPAPRNGLKVRRE